MTDNADSLNSMAVQCDDDKQAIGIAITAAENAVPHPDCKAHWSSVKLNTATARGVKTLLTCRAEDYRERIKAQNGQIERRRNDGKPRPSGIFVPWRIIIYIALTAIASAFGGHYVASSNPARIPAVENTQRP